MAPKTSGTAHGRYRFVQDFEDSFGAVHVFISVANLENKRLDVKSMQGQ
jgi:hypothetical protein